MDSFPNIDHVDLQFRHPFTMIVSGSTGSGKSEWVMRLLHNLEKMISTPIERVIYGYGELNTNILNLQRTGKIGNVPVTVHSGVPSAEQVRDCAKKEKLLLILDDLEVGMSQQYLDALFTRGSQQLGRERNFGDPTPVQQRVARLSYKLTLFGVNEKSSGRTSDSHNSHPPLPVKDRILYGSLS
ncbi:hypothetical protein niasHT_010687 [Heterodera trifolii]|uniref:Uncharacterized protein n=1 Tax=Heterodera trifolii TaxID=157864 RepID=A0ABD2LEM5_9BILA